MSEELRALQFVDAVICIYNCDNFIGDGLHAVVVLIPDHDDGIAAAGPCRRSVDGGNQLLNFLVAEDDESWIQACLRAIVIGIVVAECGAVAASMLVIALARRYQRKIRHLARPQIAPQPTGSIEGCHFGKAVEGISAFLYGSKVGEWIVLYGIQLHNFAVREGWVQYWFDLGEIREVGEISVAVIHIVGPTHRQVLLVGLPGFPSSHHLIGDGDAQCGGNSGIRSDAIDVDLARRPGDFIRAVQRRSSRVGSRSRNWANRGTRRIVSVWDSGGKVGRARCAVPQRIVVAVDPEV